MSALPVRMPWGVIASLFIAGLGSPAGAGFVYRTEQGFVATADFDGDGRLDAVEVQRDTGQFRVGYQHNPGVFTWAAGRAAGTTGISGVTVGPLLSTTRDALAVTAPALNHVQVLDVPHASAPVFPVSVYGATLGPFSPVAADIGGAGNTAHADMLFSSSLNNHGIPALELIRSNGGGAFTGLGHVNLGGLLDRGNAVSYQPGSNGVAYIDRSTRYLQVLDMSGGTIHLVAYGNTGWPDADYTVCRAPGSGPATFVCWHPGGTALRVWDVSSPGLPVEYDLGQPVRGVFTVQVGGVDHLAVLFAGELPAAIYTGPYGAAPTLVQTLPAPPAEQSVAGVLGYDGNGFVALYADPLTGASGQAEVFTHDGMAFVGAGATALPGWGHGRGNAMTFVEEPFVSSSPQRLQVLNAGDWSRDLALVGSPSVLQAIQETDQGLPDGLGNVATRDIGPADLRAAFTLANQVADSISVFSAAPAVGRAVSEVFVTPLAGIYPAGIRVSFTNAPPAPIYYRAVGDPAWNLYVRPLPLFTDTTLHYFSRDLSGAQTAIGTAAYRFTRSPDTLDSDGDGVPDYVEIAHGLDPALSGADSDGDGLLDVEELLDGTDPTEPDSDGDGVSDLNERRAGTDPNNPAETPTPPFPDGPSRVEQAVMFDLVLTPRPYDGFNNLTALSVTGTQVRVFGADHFLYDHGVTETLALGNSVTNPAVRLEALPGHQAPPFSLAITEPFFHLLATTGTIVDAGVELVGIYPTPPLEGPEVGYSYGGDTLPVEGSNWVATARNAYSNDARHLALHDLGVLDTLKAMLTERHLADRLHERGLIDSRLSTLFPGRAADAALDVLPAGALMTLQAPSTNRSYLISTVVSSLCASVEAPTTVDLQELTLRLYDVCSESGPGAPGSFPLPASTLRMFLLDGSLPPAYRAGMGLSPGTVSNAFTQAQAALANVPGRPRVEVDFEVAPHSFQQAYPVLVPVGGGAGYSLYTAQGLPYVMPESFVLPEGSRLTAELFTDVFWNHVPGTRPVEVIALSVTAIPTPSDMDADGNLLPEAYEFAVFGSAGAPAHGDRDGDGFSDLQEFLEQTDGADPLDFPPPTVPAVDLSPPEITRIEHPGAETVQLEIAWPLAYVDAFVFTVQDTGPLGGIPFAPDRELGLGDLSIELGSETEPARFYRVTMRLR